MIFQIELRKVTGRTNLFVKNHYGSGNYGKFLKSFKVSRLPPIFRSIITRNQLEKLQEIHDSLMYVSKVTNDPFEAVIENELNLFCRLLKLNPVQMLSHCYHKNNLLEIFPLLNEILSNSSYITPVELKLFYNYLEPEPLKTLAALSEEINISERQLRRYRSKLKIKIHQLFVLCRLFQPFIDKKKLLKREGDLIILKNDSITKLNEKYTLPFTHSFYQKFFSRYLPGEYQKIIFQIDHTPVYALVYSHLKEELLNELSQP